MAGMPIPDRRKMKTHRPPLEQLLPVESGGRNFSFKYEPRCKVCSAGNGTLSTVNLLLSQGATYMDVLRSLQDYNEMVPTSKKISYESIRNHQKAHMPYDGYAIREILERRATEAEKDFIEGSENILQPIAYAEIMMKKAFEAMADGTYNVYPSDGLEAAKTLHEFTKENEDQGSVVEAMAALNRIIDAVKAVVPAEYLPKLFDYIENGPPDSPVLEAIEEDDEIEEANIVFDDEEEFSEADLFEK